MNFRLLDKKLKILWVCLFTLSLEAHAELIPSTLSYTNQFGVGGYVQSPETAAIAGVAYYCSLPANISYFQICNYGGTVPADNSNASLGIVDFGIVTAGWPGSIGNYQLILVFQAYICPKDYQLINSPSGTPNCWKADPVTPPTTTTTTTTTSSTLRLSITPSQPIIPSDSEVERGKVLTSSNLALTLRRGNQPAPNISITLVSSSGNNDAIAGPSNPTNSAGNASATISTRIQPGTSTVTSSNSNIQTVQPGVISWLPAQYENQFLVTCYVVALESEYTSTRPRTNVCGLPPEKSYYSGFLSGVIRQGTGRALDGTYIKYRSGGCYYIDTCARGAGNMCSVAGTTIAVDPSVIPKSRSSTVNVAILGQRIGHDGGAWINGYHIDDFMGEIPKAQCDALGRRHSQITYIHY